MSPSARELFLSPVTRRRFLGTAAATAGGLMLGVRRSLAGRPAGANDDASTEHFWYRQQPEGPYIDSQRDRRAFGFDDTMIYLSEDNGHSWSRKLTFPDANNITFSCFLKNGNILFATRTELFLSTDNLRSVAPVTVQNADGADYLPHTPRNSDNPGWYFHPLDGVHTWDVQGVEMLVWGNYCNVRGGATPVNIYYSTDQGRTVKVAYAFGQNPAYRDNGTPGGGNTGPLLGNADNSVIARHVHCVAYNPAENAFYACTGDRERPEGHECHWLKGIYNADKDVWNWDVLISAPFNTRYKSGGINFVDGKLYWVADANGQEPYDRGIFCCDPADLAFKDKHTLLFNPEYESANMIIQDGVILAAHYATASPYTTGFIYSPDMGKTWAQYDLKEFGPHSPVRFSRKNSEGWFRIDLRTGWITRDTVMFIKPK